MEHWLITVGDWLFKGWESIGRVLVVGVLAYAGLVLFLRLSGKRTLSKMSAFDLVVTVALGSTLSTIIVSRQTGVADGLMALFLLIGLQYLVAWLSVRWLWFRRLVKGEPTMLVHQGQLLQQAMRRERVVADEIMAALRASGVVNLTGVTAVVLETDGSFTVIQAEPGQAGSTLKNIQRPEVDDPGLTPESA